MSVDADMVRPKPFAGSLTVVIALLLAAPLLSSHARAEEAFGGPTFRKGLWRFVRTLEIVKPQNVRQKLLEREMTRCVDPTQAMKATFSSALDRKLPLFAARKGQQQVHFLEPVRLHGAG